MLKKLGAVLLFFVCFLVDAQEFNSDFRSKKLLVTKDTIRFDSVPINPQRFKVLNHLNAIIPDTEYQVYFHKATLIINPNKYKEITIEYFRFPDFLTKVYTPIDKKFIVPDIRSNALLYKANTSNKDATNLKLFDGLETSGFITRGFTSGNNQDLVTNSSMDLNIQGKLSESVSIRANIFDTNIPLQENGYSQSITDFDRIFIELYSKNWRVKAGDINLNNYQSFFLNFDKQVSGLEVEATIDKNTNVLASGAIVRGQFTAYNFVGVEGNQGPYKLYGPNNEPNIVIIEGSEKVFVNGTRIYRGEERDYTIDYNMGEIQFNTTYPINNDMRVRVEFQYSDRNYSRFITYDRANYSSEKLKIAGYFYNEKDAKENPIQQSLTEEQQQILANAGNNPDLMVAPSAFVDSYAPNKILYRKVQINGIDVYEYSTNENEELYNVSYTLIGNNQGSYVLDQTLANGSVFKYVGTNLGNYEPIVRLLAPSKLQVLSFTSEYQPTEKTNIAAEIAMSNRDLNLFSTIDNNQNKGAATKLKWQQTLLDKKWKLLSEVNYQYIDDYFSTVQRFQSVEFNRDWNLINPTGNQQQVGASLILKQEDNEVSYQFQQLQLANDFKGNKHLLNSNLKLNNTYLRFNGSLLNSTSSLEENQFIRMKGVAEQSFSKSWLGAKIDVESNDRKNTQTNLYSPTSHKYREYEGYFGVGDTAKVYAKFGAIYRTNDSIKSNTFAEINKRKTLYLNSRLIQNNNTNLSVFANYRITENSFTDDEKALNSRINYNQRLFKGFIQLGTLYETSSGNVAQQDYVYVEVEPGQGFYTWIDYNENGIQEFDEFEIAEFQDQANYLRLPLPNLRYLPTQKAKWSQSITLNPIAWKEQKGIKKLLSHFYNLTYFSIDNEQERSGNTFNLNPFDLDETKQISLLYNLRNSFYFNRNRQHYSTTYTFGTSESKQQFIIGNQATDNRYHQLEFQHKIGKFWLLDVLGKQSESRLTTENFANRNYVIDILEAQPKLSYLYNNDNKFSVFYHFKNKENTVANFETLQQQKVGLEYAYLGKKRNQITANFNLFLNDFNGNPNSPVGYQMLEGLQDGTNITWNVLWNQKLNSFLNLNLNYFGRKSEGSKSIHTGSIQLRAIF